MVFSLRGRGDFFRNFRVKGPWREWFYQRGWRYFSINLPSEFCAVKIERKLYVMRLIWDYFYKWNFRWLVIKTKVWFLGGKAFSPGELKACGGCWQVRGIPPVYTMHSRGVVLYLGYPHFLTKVGYLAKGRGGSMVNGQDSNLLSYYIFQNFLSWIQWAIILILVITLSHSKVMIDNVRH